MIMKVEVDDRVIIGLINSQINDIAQKMVSESVREIDIKKIANDRINQTVYRECERIVRGGNFYDRVAKHLAIVLADKIATDIVGHIDLEEVTRLIANRIADKIKM